MIKQILILAAFIIPHTVISQTAHEPRAEQIATELLKKASERLKSFISMEVDFSYRMENTTMGVEEEMTGKIYSKDDKYRMVLGDNIFISDGETVWNYIDDFYEIHINYVENMEGGLTPTALLENFETEYRGKFIRQENFQGKTVDIIDLIPVTPQSFFKYRVALNASDQMIVFTTAYDRHGGTYTYTLDNVRTNHSLNDNLFVFNKGDFPDDIDVIDLR
ncbi:MAG: outer membrane lipoprotein carrier protein LolA [Bacteroidetes bacterium]|nr:MAG: outer membrane lipoprotein carrier protein LolA [Bacteroidota bacterium]